MDNAGLYKFKALMWKHFLSRKKNILKTCIETFFPVILFFIYFLSRNNLSTSEGERSIHETEKVTKYDLLRMSEIEKIFFAPNNSKFINELINRTELKLDLLTSPVGYEDEETLLYKNLKSLRKNSKYLAIIFHNDEEFPNNLNYTIRSSEYYMTHNTKPLLLVPGPHEQYERIYERFVSIQIAIDTTFIEMLSESKMEKTISVQSFPYPPYSKDDFWSFKYDGLLPYTTINVYFIIIIIIIGRLLVEKESGVKMLLKMMGVNRSLLWMAHYVDCIILQLINIILIVIFLKVGDQSLIPNVNTFLLGFSLFIYANYVIIFSFTISTFFSETLLASISVVAFWIISQILQSNYLDVIKSKSAAIIWSFIPNGPIIWMFQIIGFYEHGNGLQFSDIFSNENSDVPFSFGGVLILLILNCIVLALITSYVENVFPGPYGVPKPYFYFMEKIMLNLKTVTPDTESIVEKRNDEDNFEEPPSNLEIGCKIKNIWKIYSTTKYKKTALAGVSLDIYKGGITALLGHNGAGKTTLMSIITGMIPANSGNIFINGFNIRNNMDKIHKMIGLCPQENIAFPDLTVKEHIQFIAMVYGVDRSNNAYKSILNKLNLTEKENELCHNLSGGTRRRVQLALAVSGNTPILILDEPTSGLDPKHRREIWDILMNLKKDHTILLTTHYMEEADILADRIAILEHGQVKCYGTPIYLKNKICPGYKLNILKNKNCNVERITEEIKNKFSRCQINSETPTIVQYVLKSNDSKKLGMFITYLENNKQRFGISSMGLALPSIEEVFLRVSADENAVSVAIDNNDAVNNSSHSSVAENAPKGSNATLEIVMKTLLWKRYLHDKKSSLLWFTTIILLVISILAVTLITDTSDFFDEDVPMQINLSIYKQPELLIYYSVNNTEIDNLNQNLNIQDVKFQQINNTYTAILSSGQNNVSAYTNNILIAFSFDDKEYIGYYSTSVYHSLPIVVNLLTNLIAVEKLGWKSEPYFNVYNLPISREETSFNSVDLRPTSLIMMWCCVLCIAWSFSMCIFLLYPISEGLSGGRELILMTGINKFLYYASMYIHDLAFCFLFSMLMLVILFDPYKAFTGESLGAFLTVLSLYFCAIITANYGMAYMFSTVSSGFVSFFILSIISLIYSVMSYTLRDIHSGSSWFGITVWLIKMFPSTHLDVGIFNIAHIAHDRQTCINFHNIIQYKMNISSINSNEYCCERDESTGKCSGLKDYFSDKDFGINTTIYWLIFLFIFYMVILILFELKVFEKASKKILLLFDNEMKTSNNENNSSANEDVDTVDGLEKSVEVNNVTLKYVSKYYPMIKTNTTAVKSLNFNIKKGQCFGLVGLNGAGKTTTFKILTGNRIPTLGEVSVFGVKLTEDKRKYFSTISYCPQFDALGEYLTGRQALTIFANLRGVPKNMLAKEVNKILDATGMQKLADTPIGYYSGGNKRKLSLGVSLIGLQLKGTNGLILLDEPTSGVDPQSRVVLHNAILQMKMSGNSIILSSHNLSECEFLCNEIGILVDGKMECIDNAQKVKERFGFGYSLTIKLKNDTDTQDGEFDESGMSESGPIPMLDMRSNYLKRYLAENSNWHLRDHHGALLQYHVNNEDYSYSHLFSTMEDIKEKFHGDLESYAICETNLEEAFLAFIDLQKRHKPQSP